MSREIKFRAWDGKNMRTDLCSGDDLNGFFRDATIPIMQFTGIKDINKSEIYHNDIVKCKVFDGSKFFRFIGIIDIVDCVEAAWFVCGVKQYSGREFPLYKQCKIEVIGNIFKNPEMIINKY